jgi:hypothetical protein
MRTPKPDTYQTEDGMAVLCTPRSSLTPLRQRLSTACQPTQSYITPRLISAKARCVRAVDSCLSECGQ